MSFAQHAAAVAEQYPVFPCKPDRSAPYTRHGFKDASRDPVQVAAWSRMFPDALIGVPTGAVSGLCVLDVDVKGGKDGFKALADAAWTVPTTRTHHTQHGGAHYLFKTPDGVHVKSTAGVLGEGLDTRADGGFIYWWPAAGGAVDNPEVLAPAPDWLLDALNKGNAKRSITPAALPQSVAASGHNANDDLIAGTGGPLGLTHDQILVVLAALDPNMGRSDWLAVGMALHHELGEAGFSYWDAWSARAVQDKYPGTDGVRRQWDSFRPTDNPVTMRTVLKMAREVSPTFELPAAPGTAPREDEQTVAHLATLQPLAYARARTEAAKKLGVGVSVLDVAVKAVREVQQVQDHDGLFDDVEPWPEPVNGDALMREVCSTIRRFIVCDPAAMVASALWCVATWLTESVHACPILLINAPERACGKSQLLTVVGRLVPRPVQAAGISPSVLFRLVEMHQPTLLVDEVETVLTKDADDLRGLFNAGHTRDSAWVWRSVPVGKSGKDFKPCRFGVFGWKAVAGINAVSLAETLTSRAIVVQLRRKTPGEKAERLRYAPADLFSTLRRKLARWAADNAEAVRVARPDLPDQLSDRDQDNWESATAIADLCGEHWGKAARSAAIKICTTSGDSNQSIGAELLADIRDVFHAKNVTRISMHDLRSALCADDEAPWATWTRGAPISVRRLGQLLKQYGVSSTTVKLPTGLAPKGYRLEDFGDAFDRYLYTSSSTPLPPVT